MGRLTIPISGTHYGIITILFIPPHIPPESTGIDRNSGIQAESVRMGRNSQD